LQYREHREKQGDSNSDNLSVTAERVDGKPNLVFRHHDVEGRLRYVERHDEKGLVRQGTRAPSLLPCEFGHYFVSSDVME